MIKPIPYYKFLDSLPRISCFNRVLAIGDVHGHLAPLLDVFRRAQEDLCKHPLRKGQKLITVFLGDACSRGPDSKGVYEALMARKDLVAILGNHDRDFLATLKHIENPKRHSLERFGDKLRAESDTYISYGAPPLLFEGRDKTPKEARRAFEAVPKAHIDYLSSMVWGARFCGYLLIHNPLESIGIKSKKLTGPALKDMFDYLTGKNLSPTPTLPDDHQLRCMTIVHGHRPLLGLEKKIEILPHRIGLDIDETPPRPTVHAVILEAGQAPRTIAGRAP